ncbi:hypothetical protein A3762_14065 [Oleiphilus sp. HI0125]|uniref:hypothetical protein n=2 Tax=Oleiphilus sp. HI0125 TaxID=1822266 RepID=UPI0007C3402B|nr:hypothetical protein [Oleiphilus sp. HI0125]KZZ61634.1 hypothetical protein A3762_14065 [Oleiphilus sp. HI0125]
MVFVSQEDLKDLPFLMSFRHALLEGTSDNFFKKAYVCVFDHWLSRTEYSEYIGLANSDRISFYNSLRSQLFVSISAECFLLNLDDCQYYRVTDTQSVKASLAPHLNDSEGFLLVSERGFALQFGYDYTDLLHFSNSSSLKFVQTHANEIGLHVLFN